MSRFDKPRREENTHRHDDAGAHESHTDAHSLGNRDDNVDPRHNEPSPYSAQQVGTDSVDHFHGEGSAPRIEGDNNYTTQPREESPYSHNANYGNQQPRGDYGNQQSQGSGYNNQQPQATGYNNQQSRGDYSNQQSQGTGYNNQQPQGNNQQPQGSGYNNQQPQATGYNNQTPYPQPQYPQQNQQPKKKFPTWAKILILLAILFILIPLLVFGCVAVVADNAIEDSKGGKAEVSNSDNENKDDNGTPILNLGETATVKDVDITIDNARPEVSWGDQPTVCADLTYVNNSNEEFKYDSFNVKLKQPSGVIDTPNAIVDGVNELHSAAIAPGGNASGTYCWEVQDTQGEMEIPFFYNWMTSDEPNALWKFDLNT